MENSADPDQLAVKPADLNQHYFWNGIQTGLG